jgi:hypothetical protein
VWLLGLPQFEIVGPDLYVTPRVNGVTERTIGDFCSTAKRSVKGQNERPLADAMEINPRQGV